MADYKLVDIEHLEAGLTATADAIRAKTGATEEIPWDAETGMAANIEEVFDAGVDAMWDIIQNKGARTDYGSAFSSWASEGYIRPKYKVCPTAGNSMFASNRTLKKIESDYFDLSLLTNVTYLCNACSNLEEIEDIGFNFTSYSRTFRHCNSLKKITVIRSSESTTFTMAFENCEKLEDITIDGVIAQGDFDIHWSTLLSKDSITSIINALSPTTTGLTVILSLTAVNNAFETSEGAADGSTSEEWTSLAGTKSNWTISLV